MSNQQQPGSLVPLHRRPLNFMMKTRRRLLQQNNDVYRADQQTFMHHEDKHRESFKNRLVISISDTMRVKKKSKKKFTLARDFLAEALRFLTRRELAAVETVCYTFFVVIDRYLSQYPLISHLNELRVELSAKSKTCGARICTVKDIQMDVTFKKHPQPIKFDLDTSCAFLPRYLHVQQPVQIVMCLTGTHLLSTSTEVFTAVYNFLKSSLINKWHRFNFAIELERVGTHSRSEIFRGLNNLLNIFSGFGEYTLRSSAYIPIKPLDFPIMPELNVACWTKSADYVSLLLQPTLLKCSSVVLELLDEGKNDTFMLSRFRQVVGGPKMPVPVSGFDLYYQPHLRVEDVVEWLHHHEEDATTSASKMRILVINKCTLFAECSNMRALFQQLKTIFELASDPCPYILKIVGPRFQTLPAQKLWNESTSESFELSYIYSHFYHGNLICIMRVRKQNE